MHLENEKEVVITISTTQTDASGESIDSDLTVNATIGKSEGVDVIIYEIEDSVNVLLLYKNFAKMIKTGGVEAEMTFDMSKGTQAKFAVPGGTIVFDVYTKKCLTSDNESLLELEYELYSEGEFVSGYVMNISEYTA